MTDGGDRSSHTCVLVTSGGKGIGRAIVDRFPSKGAAVSICGHNQQSLTACHLKQGTIVDVDLIDISCVPGSFSRDYRDALVHWAALNRFGRPDEIASIASFLASDAASYITIQTIIVDGGFVLKHGGMSS